MNVCKVRADELVRYLASVKQFRHLSFSGEKFYTDMIMLNNRLADRAESILYTDHNYGRKERR